MLLLQTFAVSLLWAVSTIVAELRAKMMLNSQTRHLYMSSWTGNVRYDEGPTLSVVETVTHCSMYILLTEIAFYIAFCTYKIILWSDGLKSDAFVTILVHLVPQSLWAHLDGAVAVGPLVERRE